MTTDTTASRAQGVPTTPGIYRDLPFSSYCAIRAVNRGTLLDLAHNPALVPWRRAHPQPETAAMRQGAAIHTAILEPERFDREYAIGPDVKLNTKEGKLAWADFEAVNAGKILLRAKDGAQLRAIADAVRKSEAASKLLAGAGDTELTVVWEDAETGVLCKCRIDRTFRAALGQVVLDLKSTRDARPDAFALEIGREYYDFQLAFYGDGLRAALGLETEPVRAIIAYEKNAPEDGDDADLVVPPPLCSVHLIGESAIEECRGEYRDLLAFYHECDARNEWPDFSATVHTYEKRPSWIKRWKRGVA